MKEERIWAFDILRIASAFAVVLLHVSAEYFDESFYSSEWVFRNFFGQMTRWCVPVFIMISGALFLQRDDITIEKLYKKYIWRILLVYLVWSAVYASFRIGSNTNLLGFIGVVISGPLHLWFLKMLIGLYMCLPLFWMIVKDKKVEIYFIFLSFFVSVVVPLFMFVIEKTSDNYFQIFTDLGERVKFSMAMGYSYFFVLGHFLVVHPLNSRYRKMVYILGIMSVFLLLLFTYIPALQGYHPDGYYYSYKTPFIYFITAALFVFAQSHCMSIRQNLRRIVLFLSKMSLGVYVVHMLVMYVFSSSFGVDSRTFHPGYWLIIYTIIVFVSSYVVTGIIAQIPFLKKTVC
ncbi:MAG: acyltransferase [Prevotella sp.]|nr:acyltransferase [Prevotella sp.]